MKHAMAIALSLVFLVTTTTAELITWSNASGGNWNVAANWNPTNVPDAVGEWAQIGVAGTYTVTLNMSPSFDWLDITNTAATLNLDSNTLTLLDVAGLTNSGTIVANSGAATIDGGITNNAGANVNVTYGQTLAVVAATHATAGTVTVHTQSSTRSNPV